MNFKTRFLNGEADGFAIVTKSFNENNVLGHDIIVRKYVDDRLCIIVFENIEDANAELSIFNKGLNLRIGKISYRMTLKYVELMTPLLPAAVVVVTRDKNGVFDLIDFPEANPG